MPVTKRFLVAVFSTGGVNSCPLHVSRLTCLRFQENDLALDVPISWIPLTESLKFPVLRPTSFVDYMIRSGNFGMLYGQEPSDTIQSTLLEFWRRFAYENPDHMIFQTESGDSSLSRSIPCMVHGDEGRNFKRKGVMLINLQGVLGTGTKVFNERNDPESCRLQMGVNIGSHSFKSRFLLAAMQKKFYQQNSDPSQKQYISFNCCFSSNYLDKGEFDMIKFWWYPRTISMQCWTL